MDSVTCLLDTSIFIEYFRLQDKRRSSLFRHLSQAGPAMSAISLMELEMGTTSEAHRRFLGELLLRYPVLPFDQEAAAIAGQVARQLRRQNAAIEVRDLMIASVALSRNVPLATLDVEHFGRVPGLRLMDLPQT